MHVLVVEANPAMASLLAEGIRKEGHPVDAISSGRAALDVSSNRQYDLILLDCTLPDVDGIDICRALRKRGSSTLIFMLSAHEQIAERVMCLEAGADDCLSQPFDWGELFARVRAFGRRSDGLQSVVKVGPLSLNRLERRATVNGSALELTPREFELLTYLARATGRAVARRELLQEVWDLGFDTGSNVVDAHVKKVREKLGAYGGLIETVRRVGYRLGTGNTNESLRAG